MSHPEPSPDRSAPPAVAAVVVLAAGLGAALLLDLPSVATVRAWIGDAGGAGWAVMALVVALILLAP
ncbi:hypothetical protein QMK98_30060, partial [Klebsiella pneumoniae]|uniref:hypothetical protein n=1 Tax=Klebsiella pneumoniae TaxID=573 RepID=UPI003A8BB37A